MHERGADADPERLRRDVLQVMERLRQHNPESLTTESLTLEEIFFATLQS